MKRLLSSLSTVVFLGLFNFSISPVLAMLDETEVTTIRQTMLRAASREISTEIRDKKLTKHLSHLMTQTLLNGKIQEGELIGKTLSDIHREEDAYFPLFPLGPDVFRPDQTLSITYISTEQAVEPTFLHWTQSYPVDVSLDRLSITGGQQGDATILLGIHEVTTIKYGVAFTMSQFTPSFTAALKKVFGRQGVLTPFHTLNTLKVQIPTNPPPHLQAMGEKLLVLETRLREAEAVNEHYRDEAERRIEEERQRSLIRKQEDNDYEKGIGPSKER